MNQAGDGTLMVFSELDGPCTVEASAHELPRYEKRLAHLDWLRVLAILGVFIAHSIDALDSIDWHVKYQVQNMGVMILVNFGSVWGMALMILLAGSAAWFAVGSRTPAQFIGERTRRLLLPFLLGIVVLSPVEAYYEALRRSLYSGSFFRFLPSYIAGLHIGGDLRWLAAFGYHLWFLAFLFLLSILLLPLLLLLRQEGGQRFILLLAKICVLRGGPLVFALPRILVQISLRASFPGYQSWADCAVWLISFLYGFILVADSRIAQAMRSQWRILLLTGVGCLMVLLTLYKVGDAGRWEIRPDFSAGYIFYQALRGLLIWSLLALTLSIAMQVLNGSNSLLRYATEAALPVYILHYPLIVLTAFYAHQWYPTPWVAFLLISTISLSMTLLVYELLIRRIPIMRRVFGMKSTRHEERENPFPIKYGRAGHD